MIVGGYVGSWIGGRNSRRYRGGGALQDRCHARASRIRGPRAEASRRHCIVRYSQVGERGQVERATLSLACSGYAYASCLASTNPPTSPNGAIARP